VVIRLPSADLLVRLHNGLRTNLVAAVVAFPGARFDDNQGCR
jgi:hypothetical protein